MRIVKTLSVWAFAIAMGGLLASPSWALFGMGEKKQGQTTETKGKASVGNIAPEFSLKDAQGNTHSLADFRGKSVVLLWSNPDCPYVQRHEREGTFQSMTQRYDPDKVQFVEIVSNQSGPTGAATRAQHDRILTLYDPQGTVAREYGAKRTPEAFIINPSGSLSYKGAIDNDPKGKMSANERKSYVDEALSAVTNGQTPKDQSKRAYGCPIKGTGRHMWGTHRKGQSESTGMQQPSGSSQGR